MKQKSHNPRKIDPCVDIQQRRQPLGYHFSILANAAVSGILLVSVCPLSQNEPCPDCDFIAIGNSKIELGQSTNCLSSCVKLFYQLERITIVPIPQLDFP